MREFGSADVSGRVSTYLVDPFGRYIYVIGDFGMPVTNYVEVADVEVFANSLKFGRVNKIRVVHTWGFVGLNLISNRRCGSWLLANSSILRPVMKRKRSSRDLSTDALLPADKGVQISAIAEHHLAGLSEGYGRSFSRIY